MNAYDIIRRPVITEQSMEAVADKKYVFMVDVNANKTEIKAAVEQAFGVKVAKVNTIRMQGKVKRTGAYPAGKRAEYKKAKRLALKSVLSAKAAEKALVVIDEIKMDAPKTADFAKFLKAVGCETKTLVVTAAADVNVVKSGRNISGCEVTFANLLNTYDVLNADKLVVDKAALQKIEEVFA